MDNIVLKRADTLIPYVNNAKKHSSEQIKLIASSIREFGFNNPVLIDKDNGIIAGHGRVMAAQILGLEEVPTICLEHLSEAQKKAYILADNRLGEIGVEWDMDLVNIELEGLKDQGFDLEVTGFDIEQAPEEGLTDEDAVPEAPEEPVTVLGDVWLLGNHKVMCGDSTAITDVDKLMNGENADMVFTDPPYNTGMTPKTQEGVGGTLWKGSKNKGETARLSHMFDDSYTDEEWQAFMSDFCSMYYSVMRDDSVAYICLDWRRSYELIPHIKTHFHLSNIIVWDKVVHGLGSDYKYVYELIHVCKKGKPEISNKDGEKEYYDIWHIQRKIGRDDDHATKKPIEIPERAIRHASKPKDIVLDLFGGSGSTLIACEKTNRKCFMMELDPKYVQVILERWQAFTGKIATLEGDGRSFEEIKQERRGIADANT